MTHEYVGLNIKFTMIFYRLNVYWSNRLLGYFKRRISWEAFVVQ